MSIGSILKATARGVGKLPRIMSDAQYETEPDYAYPQRDTIPSLPYEDENGNSFDFGGGQSSDPKAPIEIGRHRTGRPSTFGKVMSHVPDILRAGIAGVATPNIAGGGPVDIARAMQAGGRANQVEHERQRQIGRQNEGDAYLRQYHQAQIADINAQEAERRRKSELPARYGDWIPVKGGIANKQTGEIRQGTIGPNGEFLPGIDTSQPGVDQKVKDAIMIGAAGRGGFISPETKPQQMNWPDWMGTALGPTLPPAPTVQNAPNPPPEGYVPVPYTSGPNRMVAPSAETRSELAHPTREPAPPKPFKGADGRMYTIAEDESGNQVATPIEGSPAKPISHPAARKTKAQQIAENTAAADAQGLTGEQRTMFIANGRLPAAKKDWTSEIKEVFGGGAPKPATPQSDLPPDISSKLVVGKNTKIQAPDGSVRMYVKNPDGTIKRLR